MGSLFNFSESGRGNRAQLILIRFNLRLDYMGFAMEATTKVKMGAGTTHSSPTALGLGISVPNPKILSFVFDLEGTQQCFILRDQTTGDFKFPSLASPGHTHSPVCAPRPPF